MSREELEKRLKVMRDWSDVCKLDWIDTTKIVVDMHQALKRRRANPPLAKRWELDSHPQVAVAGR
jgi:hypothetical protein